MYKNVPIQKAIHMTGKKPIGIRWIDTSKGDQANPEYRSRLVAKEIKRHSMEEMFAATPPLEAKKILFSLAMQRSQDKKSPLKLLVVDVRRAYFHARARRPVFVELPEEDAEEGMCGELLQSMYGTRDAASNWEQAYTDALISEGWTPGVTTPCVFTHPCGAKLVVHGDEFTFLGTDDMLDYCKKVMEAHFEVKVRGKLGPERGDDKCIRILNSILTWSEHCLLYECDPRHAEILVKEVGMKVGEKGNVGTPGAKIEEEDTDKPLSADLATKYRSLAARANFMALDRADIQFATKELSRFMQSPTDKSWMASVRLAKYLRWRPGYVQRFEIQEWHGHINVYVGSDWAGEGSTRKSTSGGAICIGDHPVRIWASTQSVIALSSGEAKFYAIVRGASIGLGMQSLLDDSGERSRVKILTDATTGKSLAARRGLGKVRHIEVSELWIQQKVRDNKIELTKIKGTFNLADLFTKHVDRAKLDQMVEALGGVHMAGRSEIAPDLDVLVDASLNTEILSYLHLKHYDLNASVETHIMHEDP